MGCQADRLHQLRPFKCATRKFAPRCTEVHTVAAHLSRRVEAEFTLTAQEVANLNAIKSDKKSPSRSFALRGSSDRIVCQAAR
jgi:hypothetical protein